MDRDISPATWPVGDVVKILASADAARDPRISELLVRIDALENGLSEVATEATLPVRSAA